MVLVQDMGKWTTKLVSEEKCVSTQLVLLRSFNLLDVVMINRADYP